MKITIECTPEEARDFPNLTGLEKSLGELVDQAITVEKNKEVLHRFQEEVFKAGDWSTENLLRFLTPDIIDHTSRPGDTPGLEGVQSRFTEWRYSFQEAVEEEVLVAGEGDLVAIHYDLKAKHTGEFMGIEPTNEPVSIPGIQFLRFENGKIAEHWGIYDYMSTAAEIGARLRFEPLKPKTPEVPLIPDVLGTDEVKDYGN